MWRVLVAVAWTAAAVAIGYAWGRGEVPPPTPAVTSTRQPAPDRALTDCRRSLTAMGGIIDAQLAAAAGPAAPFPPDLPPQYTAAGFEAALRAAVAECEPERLRLIQVDCSEYPCIGVFTQPAGTYGSAIGVLTHCPAWTSQFGGGTTGNGAFQTDAGPAEFSIVGAVPDRLGFDKDGQTRWQTRFDAARDVAMDALGGREPTEAEKLDADIRFWNHVRDKGIGDPGEIEATLAELQEKRAAMGE